MSPVTIAEDTEPLITAQFSSEQDSPRVSGFYDVLENSTDNPDREASMDLAGGGDSLPSASSELRYQYYSLICVYIVHTDTEITI